MAHPICRTEREEGLPYLQRLWDTVFAPDVDMWAKLQELFADETEDFDLEYGFFTRIDTNEGIQYLEVVHGPDDRVPGGETVPLSETYCRKTISEPTGTMAISNASEEGWADDPAYESFGLESYLGTTVRTEDELYGTLCFATSEPRADPLQEEELKLVELFGEWASYELDQWKGPPTHDTVTRSTAEPALPSSRVDTMMDALVNRERRLLLQTLSKDGDVDRVDFVDRHVDAGNARTRLYHNHLPKLQEAGYVEWDRDTDELSRGPSFDDVEPLLRLLRAYTDDRPN